ncbi:hypothetical protein J3F83DRAFT_711764 [Trichoderma novae-zelandiae]
MGIQDLKAAITVTVKVTIKETIKAACRRPWTFLRRKRGRGEASAGSSITVTRTITQTTSQATTPDIPPLMTCTHPFARRGRAWSPSLLTINSEMEFSPEGSPPGAALGIPPEHILDENPSPVDAPIPLHFPRTPTPDTLADTLSRADDTMVKVLSPFDDASSIAFGDSPFVGTVEVDRFSDDGQQETSSATLGASKGAFEDAALSLQEHQASIPFKRYAILYFP